MSVTILSDLVTFLLLHLDKGLSEHGFRADTSMLTFVCGQLCNGVIISDVLSLQSSFLWEDQCH